MSVFNAVLPEGLMKIAIIFCFSVLSVAVLSPSLSTTGCFDGGHVCPTMFFRETGRPVHVWITLKFLSYSTSVVPVNNVNLHDGSLYSVVLCQIPLAPTWVHVLPSFNPQQVMTDTRHVAYLKCPLVTYNCFLSRIFEELFQVIGTISTHLHSPK